MAKRSDEDFFAGKRPWSLIKDQVLKDYMTPYLAKVKILRRPILLIDGYAGPGVFEDGAEGSPVIICKAAEQLVKGNYQAKFINSEARYHKKLETVIQREGWSGSAQAIKGDTTALLQTLPGSLKDQTVFLYLDPFGPTGCEFSLLEPFLKRNRQYSTEILLTMNMPGMHRFASRYAIEKGRQDEQHIQSHHQIMDKIFGGEYWRKIMFDENLNPEEQEMQLIEQYRLKLARHLPYTGSCPVREKTDKRIKYFIVFASRHQDAMLLLNDIMAKAYFSGMHKADFVGGLWEDIDWREMRVADDLDEVILSMVAQYSGQTRKFLWSMIVQQHFMRYLRPEYHTAVRKLLNGKKLNSPSFSATGKLNDDIQLYLS